MIAVQGRSVLNFGARAGASVDCCSGCGSGPRDLHLPGAALHFTMSNTRVAEGARFGLSSCLAMIGGSIRLQGSGCGSPRASVAPAPWGALASARVQAPRARGTPWATSGGRCRRPGARSGPTAAPRRGAWPGLQFRASRQRACVRLDKSGLRGV